TAAATAMKTFVTGLTARNQCPTIVLPRGDILVDNPDITINVQPTPCANNPAVSGGTVIGGGMQLIGQGDGTTRIIWTHKFWADLNSSAICLNGPTSTGCHVEPPNATWRDFTFEGLGESRNGTTDPTRVLVMQN